MIWFSLAALALSVYFLAWANAQLREAVVIARRAEAESKKAAALYNACIDLNNEAMAIGKILSDAQG